MTSDMEFVPLDSVSPKTPLGREPWGKAIEMLSNLEGGVPNVDNSADNDDDEIGIYDGGGRKLFAFHSDGTVECAAYSEMPYAAVIFFREVVNVARSQGYTVIELDDTWHPLRNSPESEAN